MFTASVTGINQNLALFDRYARDLDDFDKADVAADMVSMLLAEHGVSANVAALKAAHRMSANILDILA